jgi:CDP-glycerol glycerophosphotransferase (TagB/SpsB family)
MIKLLFEVGHLYHRAVFDPLYRVLRQDPRYEMAFVCSFDAERYFGLFTRSLKRQIEARFRSEGLPVAEDTHGFDVVIVGDTVRDPRRYGRTLLCLVNHSTGIKNMLYRNLKTHSRTRYQIFVEGKYRAERIRQAGAEGKSTIHIVGMTKFDPLFWPEFPKRAMILKRLGLDPDKPTVLFAPTYKPSCIEVVREQILTETRDYNLIIKLHHYSWRGKYAPHWHHRLYEQAVPRYPHAVLIPEADYNILPYLYAADTIVSEASSTMLEFLALNKTGIIVVLPGEHLTHHNGTPLLSEEPRQFLAGAFLHIHHPSEIGEAVAMALRDDPERREAARRYRDDFYFALDGRASQRVKTTIERLLAEGGHAHYP